jgi:hypothetical protein
MSGAATAAETGFSRGGFTGNFSPIQQFGPIHYAPISGVRTLLELETEVSSQSDKDSEIIRAQFETSISESGVALAWQIKLLRLESDRNTMSPTLPIIDARRNTTRRGETTSLQLSFPAMEAVSGTRLPDDKIRRSLSRRLQNFTAVLPIFKDRPLSSGDRLFTKDVAPILGSPDSGIMARGEIIGTIIGKTMVSDRPGLLISITGVIEISIEGSKLVGPVSGHSVIDLKSGLMSASLVESTLQGSIEGKHRQLVLRRRISTEFPK